MRQVCLEAVWNLEGQAPEVVQARHRSAQDKSRIGKEHQGSQGRPRAEDVKGTVGLR